MNAEARKNRTLDLDALESTLSSAAVSDSLDAHGRTDRVLDSTLRPVAGGSTLIGRAATVQVVATYEDHADPYRGMIETVDAASPGSLLVIGSGGLATCGLWGELFSAAAMSRGARGTVLDGYSRDTAKIDALEYPVFALGGRPIDMRQRAQFLHRDRPVEIGGVLIEPGELVFGDRDGVVAVPLDIEHSVVAAALERLGTESTVADALLRGETMAVVWERHRVL